MKNFISKLTRSDVSGTQDRPSYEELERQRDTYKEAFETTATDRDRIQTVLDQHGDLLAFRDVAYDKLILAMSAFSLYKNIGVDVNDLPDRLLKSWDQLGLVVPVEDAPDANTLKHIVAEGLLDVAEATLRVAYAGDFGLDIVELYRKFKPELPDRQHSINAYYYRRGSFEEHKKLYEDAIQRGDFPDKATLELQNEAISRGLPSVLLVTLPKSGSIFIWETIARSLHLPKMTVALRAGVNDQRLIPSMVRTFAHGGMTAQEHINPTFENIDILKEYNIQQFIVHFRDPRQAAVSWWHYTDTIGMRKNDDLTQHEIENVIFERFLVPQVQWLRGWLDVADNDPELDIVLSTQEKMAGNEAAHIELLLGRLEVPQKQIEIATTTKSNSTHFRKGATDEWLEFFSDEFKQRSADLLPKEIVRRFGWVEI